MAFLAFCPAAAAAVVAAVTTALAAALVFSTFVVGLLTRPPSPFFFEGVVAAGLLFVFAILMRFVRRLKSFWYRVLEVGKVMGDQKIL